MLPFVKNHTYRGAFRTRSNTQEGLFWKLSKYGVFYGPYFPAFKLNIVSLRIQSECGKYGPDKTTYLDTFQAVKLLTIFAKTSNSPWSFAVIWIPQRNSSRWTSIERTWDIHMTGNFFKIWEVKPFHPVTAKTWERKKLVSKPLSGISLGNLVYLPSDLVIVLQRMRHRKLFTSF